MPPLRKILIANRGEIAVRVMKTCREMGVATVAVHSDADKNALHVRSADEAVNIGGASPGESYLRGEAVIEAARKTGADAIHPGYGFLSESAAFAEDCAKAGIIFIGPPAEAMRKMGAKADAKRTLEGSGVPQIPGVYGKALSDAEWKKEAGALGFPLLIKASAGGGGKGMRVVKNADEFLPALEAVRREAKSAFGDDAVLLEKYLARPRHVEFQVFGDAHGNAVHLFERECSIQRRHQKIIEETPSPALDSKLRKKMGEAALAVVAAAGYQNAGTVEFLLDEDKNFYFLELNARLQVEHPVTELTTGLDLVRWQIEVAAGAPLPLTQKDIKQNGHAVECRIYAENPASGFLPSTGTLRVLRHPEGEHVRCDYGVEEGDEVSPYYDPMLAKLCAWGKTRKEALERMRGALGDYPILGVRTNVEFLRAVVSHPAFAEGATHTHFIEEHFPAWKPSEEMSDAELAAAALGEYLLKTAPRVAASGKKPRHDAWSDARGWRNA